MGIAGTGLAAVICAVGLLLGPGPAAAGDAGNGGFSHALLDSVLGRYVDASGLVDYAGLKADPSQLARYCARLAEVSPDSRPERFPSAEDRLAYWINAYNAFVLKGVCDAYPVDSVKDIKLFFGFFKRTHFVAGGRRLTLDDIEHGTIRERFDEPRIHAAVNCAAVSCPRLRREAFRPADLDAQLERAMRDFAGGGRHVAVDTASGTVRVSKLFDWYGEDFTGWYERRFGVSEATVLDYIGLYRGPKDRRFFKTDPKVRFMDYDWALNDQARRR